MSQERLTAALSRSCRIERELGQGGMATTRLVPRFSPDGRRNAMSADFRGTSAAWVLSLADRTLLKLGMPFMPSSLEWTADGGRILGASLTSRVFWQATDGSDTASVLLRVENRQVIGLSLAPDQRTLALAVGQALSRFDIVSRSLQGDTTSSSVATSAANEGAPRFSPDGKWLAYTSDESGRYEVFARSNSGPGSRVQLAEIVIWTNWLRELKTRMANGR